MAVEILTPKYRRDPNEMIESVYHGVAPGNRTVTTIRRPSLDRNRMETTKVYGPGLKRGESGRVAVLVLGGMETTLDEMEYILQAKREKKFVPKRGMGEIADMCRLIGDRRNEMIEERRKNMPARSKKRTVRLHLPVGYRYARTDEPGLRLRVQV